MPKVQIQFHADRREAVLLAVTWARDHGLTAVLERFFPAYEALEVPDGELSATLEKLPQIDRVALCRTDPDLGAGTSHEFVSRNPSSLFLSIGSHGEDGLRESALGGVTQDAETLRIWRNLIRSAKSRMHIGAQVRNRAADAVRRAPAHLHTPGAHDLAARGVPMLAAAGWNEFEFDDCTPSEPKTDRERHEKERGDDLTGPLGDQASRRDGTRIMRSRRTRTVACPPRDRGCLACAATARAR